MTTTTNTLIHIYIYIYRFLHSRNDFSLFSGGGPTAACEGRAGKLEKKKNYMKFRMRNYEI